MQGVCEDLVSLKKKVVTTLPYITISMVRMKGWNLTRFLDFGLRTEQTIFSDRVGMI